MANKTRNVYDFTTQFNLDLKIKLMSLKVWSTDDVS